MTSAPEIVVARSETDVADAVRAAMETKTAFEIVSRGSKRAYGRPFAPDAILDVGGLSGIVKYEPEELVVIAQAATPVADIETALAERRQMLGFAPTAWSVLFGGHPG